MTGLLAYDPDRLRRLRRLLVDVATGPLARRPPDPLAGDARLAAGRAVSVAETAVRRLDRVLALDPLASGASAGVLALDPTASEPRVDAVHAARIGAVVGELPVEALTPALLGALATEAEVLVHSSAAAVAFGRAVGGDGLLRLAVPVSARVQDGDTRDRAALGSVSRLVGVAARLDAGVSSSVRTALIRAEPHAAALVLADGRFGETVVAGVLPRLVQAATEAPAVLAPRGPSVGALLADALTALPELARRLLPTWSAAEQVAVLEGPFGVAAAAGGRLLAAAADPLSGPLAEVVAFVDWLVGFFRAHRGLADRSALGGHLGAAFAPWVVDLAPVDRAAFPDFPPSRLSGPGEDVLELVASQPGASAVLSASADDELRRQTQASWGDPAYEARLQPYARLSASIDAWGVEGARRDADDRWGRHRTNLTVIGELAAIGAGFAGKVAGQVLGQVTPYAVQRVGELLPHPPPPSTNARVADTTQWLRATTARDTALTGLFAGAVAAGDLPPSTPPPPRLGATALARCGGECDPGEAGATDQEVGARELEDWVQAAPNEPERAVRDDLRARLDAFLRAYGTRVQGER